MDRVCDLHPFKQNRRRTPKVQRKVLRLGEMVSVPGVHTSLYKFQSTCNLQERLRFNVGGLRFEILKKNLDRFPDTLLGGDRKSQFFDTKRNEFFFDRDPVTFKYVLDFYRTGKFHISTPDCMESIKDELAFFGIPEAFVSECCCEHIDFENDQKGERIAVQKKLPEIYGGKQKLYDFLTDFKSSILAAVFSYFFVLVVVINIGIIVGETLECGLEETCGVYYKNEFFCVDTFCVAVFTFEFFSRLWSCPDRREFIKDISNVVDLIGILPYYFGIIERLIATNSNFLQSLITILRIFRIFRVIKLARHSEQFQTLLLSIGQAAGELGGILFSFLALMVMFSSMIFLFEGGGTENKHGFTSIPSAFWYTLVTMTTLGYGDIFPVTFLGKVFGCACALAGVVLLALPVPIIEEKLNANTKKLSRKKYQKPSVGLQLTKRLATSMASLSRLKHLKKVTGMTTNASQSSAIELEKTSSDFSSDDTIKATFVEMSEMQPVQIEDSCVGLDQSCIKKHNPRKKDENISGFSNERLSSLDSISSQKQDVDNSVKATRTLSAAVGSYLGAKRGKRHDSDSYDGENIFL